MLGSAEKNKIFASLLAEFFVFVLPHSLRECSRVFFILVSICVIGGSIK